MQRFSALYLSLDSSTSTRHRVQAMQDYFAQVPAEDAAWAVYFLAGGKPRQAVGTRVLRETGARAAGMPDWLFDECYEAVGDLAETLALILPPPRVVSDLPLHHWVGVLGALRASPPAEKPEQLIAAWQVLGSGDAATQGVGTMTETRWKATRDYMVKEGLLKADAPWQKAFTLDVVKQLKVMP